MDLDPISQFEGEDGFSSNKYRKGGVVTASNPEFESALFGYFTYIGKLAHSTRYIENQCIAGFHFVGETAAVGILQAAIRSGDQSSN